MRQGRGLLGSVLAMVVLTSACRGAAVVDAPVTAPTSAEPAQLTREQGSSPHSADLRGDPDTSEGRRVARSVPGVGVAEGPAHSNQETVLNYFEDYASELGDTWPPVRPLARHVAQQHALPVSRDYSDSSRDRSRDPTWQLEPQVGKTRGKRVRGGQSYYRDSARARDSEQLLGAVQESLDAAERSAATTMMSRQQRNGRRYDVPQIGRNISTPAPCPSLSPCLMVRVHS